MPNTNGDIDAQWFKDRLRDRELSQRKLAKLLGTGPSAVSLMLSGKRNITLTEAADLSRLLGLPINEVLEHAGIDVGHPANAVPLVGTMDAEGEVHSAKPGHRVKSPIGLPENTVAVVIDDTTAPAYGWTYFYEPRSGVDADCVGRLCLVQTKAGQQYIRFLKPGRERGTYTLIGWFSVSIDNVKVQSASPVLWIKV